MTLSVDLTRAWTASAPAR